MKFNSDVFKQNKKFFIIAISGLLIALLIAIFSDIEFKNLEKKALTNEESNITKLIINEVTSNNNGIIADENGNVYDFVELYNGSNNEIELLNYGLTDESGEVKWTFPDVTIKSKDYLIIYLSGKNESGLNAPFKLKSGGGETIALLKPNGSVHDAVELTSLENNYSMYRDEVGSWAITDTPTPGYANTIDGHEAFLKSLILEDQTLIINEFLINNQGNYLNEENKLNGFIEIKNISDDTINLENYSLSNDENVSFKWQFPDVKLKPGEIISVSNSGDSNKSDNLSTGFKLDNNTGDVVLTNNQGKVINKYSYENIPNGVSMIYGEGGYFESYTISPGYENDLDGINEFQEKYLKTNEDLIISEVVNSNSSYLPQNGANYYDFIEIYNNSNKEINLSDYCISSNLDNICEYKMPDVTLKEKEYYVIMASGDTNLTNNNYYHAGFKVGDKEGIYITKGSKVIDSIFVGGVDNNKSIGKNIDYGVYYYDEVTPLSKNSYGIQAISSSPIASVDSGVYNDSTLEVKLLGSNDIYYTLDGSTPSASSKKYSSPLEINETTVLKLINKNGSMRSSEVETYSYVVNENHNIAVMSLTINPNDLSTIHNDAWTLGVERPVHVKYTDVNGEGFEIDAGLKLFGGSTRGHPKKSYEIKFRSEYGPTHLHYQVFDNRESTVYNSLVLRTGSQDEMGIASRKTIIKDLVPTSLVDEYTDVDVQSYKPVALYLNGEYHGLYFIREKVDETFVSNNYNVEATKENTDILRIDGEVKSGTIDNYNELMDFISNNSLKDEENYNYVKKQIDIENICDFWIAENWTGNYDMVNLRYFSNPNIDDGAWHYIFYDLDFSMYIVQRDYYKFSTSTEGMTEYAYSTFLLRNLMESEQFQKTYLERLSYNLKNTWNEETVIKKIDEIINEISTEEIARNLDRWDMSYSKWEEDIEFMKEYARNRNEYVLKQTKSYFNLSNDEYESYFGDIS